MKNHSTWSTFVILGTCFCLLQACDYSSMTTELTGDHQVASSSEGFAQASASGSSSSSIDLSMQLIESNHYLRFFKSETLAPGAGFDKVAVTDVYGSRYRNERSSALKAGDVPTTVEVGGGDGDFFEISVDGNVFHKKGVRVEFKVGQRVWLKIVSRPNAGQTLRPVVTLNWEFWGFDIYGKPISLVYTRSKDVPVDIKITSNGCKAETLTFAPHYFSQYLYCFKKTEPRYLGMAAQCFDDAAITKDSYVDKDKTWWPSAGVSAPVPAAASGSKFIHFCKDINEFVGNTNDVYATAYKDPFSGQMSRKSTLNQCVALDEVVYTCNAEGKWEHTSGSCHLIPLGCG